MHLPRHDQKCWSPGARHQAAPGCVLATASNNHAAMLAGTLSNKTVGCFMALGPEDLKDVIGEVLVGVPAELVFFCAPSRETRPGDDQQERAQ